MADLLSVEAAIEQISASINDLGTEKIPLKGALGRVLAQDLISDSNLPPFANSSMDGFAIQASDSQGASQAVGIGLKVVMDILAGTMPSQVLQAGEVARIMTGAPIPEGADAVIPVEETDADFSQSALPETVQIFKAQAKGANIRAIGENIRLGQTVLKSGMVIRPAEIAVLAALGQAQVEVLNRPKVLIIGTGDELVDVTETLTEGKIRDVNSYALEAQVKELGAEVRRLPIAKDSPQAVRELFESAIAQHPDLIISSAGVSVGAADYIRTILAEMGEINFWKINMRPGKPLAYGHLGDIPFFGLPGNPVSAMLTFEVLVRPILLKMLGKADDSQYVQALVGEKMHSDGRRTYARVVLERENGQLVAYETGTQSSGAFLSLVLADGLLIIPEGVKVVEVGTALEVKLLKML